MVCIVYFIYIQFILPCSLRALPSPKMAAAASPTTCCRGRFLLADTARGGVAAAPDWLLRGGGEGNKMAGGGWEKPPQRRRRSRLRSPPAMEEPPLQQPLPPGEDGEEEGEEEEETDAEWSFVDREMEAVALRDLPSATIACNLDPRVFQDGPCRVSRAGSREGGKGCGAGAVAVLWGHLHLREVSGG